MSEANLELAKQRMLRRQLRQRGIGDRRVLAAMAKVPRERFLDQSLRREAYADRALAIQCGQTISQPYIVGLMTQALQLQGEERVLEIGTGSGYQAAILAELAREVISIERHPELSRQAGAILAELGYQNVRLIVGDGTLGWPERAPYERIVVTAAAAQVPPPLFQQLTEGGLIVLPVGNLDCQVLQLIRKVSGVAEASVLTACRFVPLVGAQGRPE
ncbi:MAG: protein-L-isoaspartate(D-aspartate) O-methyltransferase [Thermoguttaceae bacterium]|jgi:protein-L-isoaspartate(D-aspartate) O-methyltransferase